MKLSRKQIREASILGLGLLIGIIVITIARPVEVSNQTRWRNHFNNNAKNVLVAKNVEYERRIRHKKVDLIQLSDNYTKDIYIKFEVHNNQLKYNFSNLQTTTPGMTEYGNLLQADLISQYIVLDKFDLRTYIAHVHNKLDAEGIDPNRFTHLEFELLQDNTTNKIKFINFAIVNNRIHSSIAAHNYNSICPTVCPF